jgi:putative oxidoreductase
VNVALLILRVVVGVLFVGHGAQKLFGWFGGHGLEGTGGFYESVGYRPGRQMAIIGGVTEFGGGLLLALGLLTPLGAAAIIGQMTAATLAVHIDKGVWNSDGGFELPLIYAVAAFVIAYLGPGAVSLDEAFDLANGGSGYALGALFVGVGVALLMEAYRRAQMREISEERAAEEHAAQEEERRAA